MIIAIDIDNTINNLQEAVTTLFNKHCGTNYSMEDFTEYNVENILPVKEAVIMKELYANESIYDFVRPIDGAQDGVQKLINDGHQVYFLTDAIPKNFYEKIQWVKHFFPFIDEAHIVSMKHKKLFKCDVMIEDNLENLISGHHYHRICMNYPWNTKVYDYVYDIQRCNCWEEIVNIVNKINEEE